MAVHPLAGKPAPSRMLIDVARLEREYYERKPDPNDPRQLVRFGTSGHRGTSFDGTLTEGHILAIAQEIIATQQEEIAAMRRAVGEPLPPSAPSPDQTTQAASPDAHPTSRSTHVEPGL